MKGAPLTTLLVALLLPALAQTVPGDWPAPSEIAPEPIAYQAPEPLHATLSNGIEVYLLEDRSLPLVQGVAYVEAPSAFDPPGLEGLAAITATMLREGGTSQLTPDELDLRLEELAGSVEGASIDVLASVSFDTLTDTRDEVMGLWRDVLLEPRFDEGRLQVLKQRQVEAIRRVVDDPVQLAFREFVRLAYDGHPAGAQPTEASVAAVGQQEVRDFYDSYFGPANTVVAVTGDFEAQEMLGALEGLLGGWQNELASPPEVPPVAPPEGSIYLLHRPITQSVVIVGHPAVRAYTPEYNDLDVANYVLGGGGFSSRLFEEIRTRRGLAYSTGSALSQGFDWPGLFYAFTISPAGETGAVLELLLSEVERLQEQGVGEEELENARRSILNASLFRFASPADVTARTARVRLLGLDPDYYERYIENLQTIGADQVREVAREELDLGRAIILVVGDASQVAEALEPFGEVETLELE